MCAYLPTLKNIEKFPETRHFFFFVPNEPKKVELLSKNVKYGQNLNFMYGRHGYQNKILGDSSVIIYYDNFLFFIS